MLRRAVSTVVFVIITKIVFYASACIFLDGGGSEFVASPTPPSAVAAHKIAIFARTLHEGLIMHTAKWYWLNLW
jgi:hypothetical protein